MRGCRKGTLIRPFHLAATEVTAGAFLSFWRDAAINRWLTSLADASRKDDSRRAWPCERGNPRPAERAG